MKIEDDELHYRYTLVVLKALHLDAQSFFYDIASGRPYEIQIYKWIDKLYKQGKNPNKAIQLIYRVRKLFIIRV